MTFVVEIMRELMEHRVFFISVEVAAHHNARLGWQVTKANIRIVHHLVVEVLKLGVEELLCVLGRARNRRLVHHRGWQRIEFKKPISFVFTLLV
jgi:hypothetical protein